MNLPFAAELQARVQEAIAKRAFDRTARAVLTSRPLAIRGDAPLFLSMVRHRDVLPYLLAIKSLYSAVGQGRVCVINDGSLTEADLDILRHHVPELELFDIASIDTGACPPGGCWERLIKAIELSQESYVIQADADTLTCGETPEVIRCWQENRSFILGTNSGQRVGSMQEVAMMVRSWIRDNAWTDLSLGVEAEAALASLPSAGTRLYVHGSAGFAGFARGTFARADLEEFSLGMTEVLGTARWQQWGSEQIASNYMLANSPRAQVLPYPRYACFEPHIAAADCAVLHFYGTFRYEKGAYRGAAKAFLGRYESSGGSLTARSSSGTSSRNSSISLPGDD